MFCSFLRRPLLVRNDSRVTRLWPLHQSVNRRNYSLRPVVRKCCPKCDALSCGGAISPPSAPAAPVSKKPEHRIFHAPGSGAVHVVEGWIVSLCGGSTREMHINSISVTCPRKFSYSNAPQPFPRLHVLAKRKATNEAYALISRTFRSYFAQIPKTLVITQPPCPPSFGFVHRPVAPRSHDPYLLEKWVLRHYS